MKQVNFSKYVAWIPELSGKPSALVIVFSLCFSFFFVDFWRPYNAETKGHNFYWDVFGYYSYLPAMFCNGGSMEFPNDLSDHNPPGPLGTHVPKYTYGMSIMYAPFFALGYKIAYNQKSPLDGFSEPFVTCIHWGSIFYVLLGLFFLRKFLLNYFNEIVTSVTLLCVLFGSMLFMYTFVQSELTHGYLFSLFSIFLYLTQKWHISHQYKYTWWLGLVIGLIALIRPTEAFVFLFFVFWNVRSRVELKEKFVLFKDKYLHFLVIALVAVLLWIPQLIFYKYHAGKFFYFSYMRERFFWDDPQIINVLLSYRKGWITYTPIVLLCFIGFFFIRKQFPLSKWTLIGATSLSLYVLSCWWDWNYGGCFGARSFCQHIAFLSIPLASILNHFFYSEKKYALKGVLSLLVVVWCFSCICLNIGHTYQYNHNKKIHPWATSKSIYWKVLRTYKFTDAYNYKWYSELDEPDFLKYSDGSDRSR